MVSLARPRSGRLKYVEMRSLPAIAPLPRRPTIYEINAAVWLNELGTDLAGVPAEAWDRLAALPVDVV